MKVQEVTGALLDYWVARAEGWTFGPPHRTHEWDVWRDSDGSIVGTIPAQAFQPSTDWAQAGPIIERERIALDPLTRQGTTGEWVAQITGPCQFADTPLGAAMRAYVASKFGDEVPDEVTT